MRVEYDAPKPYRHNSPSFDKKGRVTERVTNGLENVLSAYVEAAKGSSVSFENNPANYAISRVHVVGSAAHSNEENSDLDFLLIAPNLDDITAKHMKVVLAYVFFCDRPKNEAIDVYVRKKDAYPERASIDITDQVKILLDKYNSMLNAGAK